MYTGIIVDDLAQGYNDVDRVVYNGRGRQLDLEASLKVVNHSPTGFSWGYTGSGPAQLALAILLDRFNGDRKRALALYNDFMWKVIARLGQNDDFVLTDEQVESAIAEIDAARTKAE